MRISKEFTFEAAHVLPNHKGKCSRLHGHSWVFTVSVDGDRDPTTGFVMDYADIKQLVDPTIFGLDHYNLGDPSVEPKDYSPLLPRVFYPSSENLIWWLASQMSVLDRYDNVPPGEVMTTKDFARGGRRLIVGWSELRLNETCTSSCILTREEYDRKVGQR